ncbi:MAG: M23 family metallopeptidase [Dehalococcoidia bacterium]|nr:M23 family metallopeptidase [Dehalococcoidia bacterium]
MDRTEHSERWWQYVLFSLGVVIIATLACGVSPERPELQPPTVNIGLKLEDFLEWLGLFPKNIIPPPWIVKPLTTDYIEQNSFQVQGWAINSADRPGVPNTRPIVTLYEVDYPVNPSEVRKLGQTEVGDKRKWSIDNVPMEGNRLVIAAKVSIALPGGLRQYSDFSNRITMHRDKPPAAIIESPQDGTTTREETITVRGTGLAGYDIVLLRNGKEVGVRTADKDSRWQFDDVKLDLFENTFVAGIRGTDVESEKVQVKRIFSIWWPFSETSHGTVNAWWGRNDFHTRWNYGPHAGIDIGPTDNDREVLAVAPGKVIAKGYDNRGGYYVLVDHGDWMSGYLHLKEEGRKDKGSVLTASDRAIGTASNSGLWATGVHLHVEIRRWPKSVAEAEDEDKAKEDVLKKTSFLKLECVNINPPRHGRGGNYASWLKDHKNIDLHVEWGDADYWEINWTQVSYMSGGLPKDYNKTYCASPWGLGFECIKQGNCHWCPWKKE